MDEHIETSSADGIMTIRMNRLDKKNALTSAMYAGLASALDKAFAHKDIRVVVILGVPGSFSAGNDITDFLQVAMSGKRESMAVFDFLERIIMAPKPVVAGVDGLAIGIGTTMLLHCDYVVASDDSLFRTPFVDLGVIPEAGSSLLAPRLIGHHRAFALLAMGEALSAEDARQAGFVNRIVPSADIEETALAVAGDIAAKPPEAMTITRDLVRGDRTDILARMREEAELFGERLKSAEARSAFLAFMNRRDTAAS
ncbi:MAG: crotonase/enoyl-CoA hydratase family protein [Salaquimonas sp.]|jgi:enoyl-CoA hydratase/carnithine racemase|nr:crotonase/enoyl-CoA hydratase family protein [Salaquimonas sp.]